MDSTHRFILTLGYSFLLQFLLCMIELVLEISNLKILYIYENKINSLTIFRQNSTQYSHRLTVIFIVSTFLKAFFKRTIIWIQYYTIVETSSSLVVKCIGIINVNLLLCVQWYAFIVILNLHMNWVGTLFLLRLVSDMFNNLFISSFKNLFWLNLFFCQKFLCSVSSLYFFKKNKYII